MKPVIIIPAYSRPQALTRLLNSINCADYPSNDTRVIISLDGDASESVRKTATNFSFDHGTVEINEQETHLGLRKHIIWCGDQTEIYDSVIVLEDDLFVDRYFYHFATHSLQFYQNEEKISGISLYSYAYNPVSKLAFQPMYNGFLGFFMQVPSSCGQAWTANQWKRFKTWYDGASADKLEKNQGLPKIIKNWPESSWKKYFYAYMVELNLYFFYPYLSYSTNFSDHGGVHAKTATNFHHVALGAFKRPEDQFRFCRFKESTVYYDAFLEPLAPELFDEIGYSPNEIEIDFYGTKPISLLRRKKYVLTSKKCKNAMKIFRLGPRPIEKSVLNTVSGKSVPEFGYSDHIYLAKSNNIISEKRPFFEQVNYHSHFQMNNKYFFRRYMLYLITNLIGTDKQ